MLNAELTCDSCGRDYRGDATLSAGTVCPADDCPSHWEERGVPHPDHPRVHLNGTSKRDLLLQQHETILALRGALETMARNGPHGRDYYVIDSDAFTRARDAHEGRMNALADIIGEVQKIAEAIDAQG